MDLLLDHASQATLAAEKARYEEIISALQSEGDARLSEVR